MRNLDIFLSRTVYYEVSHKREKCCREKLATFSEFSKLPFQTKCKYEYSTLRRIFLMPKKIDLNTKGFVFSSLGKGFSHVKMAYRYCCDYEGIIGVQELLLITNEVTKQWQGK